MRWIYCAATLMFAPSLALAASGPLRHTVGGRSCHTYNSAHHSRSGRCPLLLRRAKPVSVPIVVQGGAAPPGEAAVTISPARDGPAGRLSAAELQATTTSADEVLVHAPIPEIYSRDQAHQQALIDAVRARRAQEQVDQTRDLVKDSIQP